MIKWFCSNWTNKKYWVAYLISKHQESSQMLKCIKSKNIFFLLYTFILNFSFVKSWVFPMIKPIPNQARSSKCHKHRDQSHNNQRKPRLGKSYTWRQWKSHERCDNFSTRRKRIEPSAYINNNKALSTRNVWYIPLVENVKMPLILIKWNVKGKLTCGKSDCQVAAPSLHCQGKFPLGEKRININQISLKSPSVNKWAHRWKLSEGVEMNDHFQVNVLSRCQRKVSA